MPNGVIQIPGIYDDVEAAGAGREFESWKRLPFDEASFLRRKSGRPR